MPYALCYLNMETGETSFSEWDALAWYREGYTVEAIKEEKRARHHLEHRKDRAVARAVYGSPRGVRLDRRRGDPGFSGYRRVAR